jgi:hypothetical protein
LLPISLFQAKLHFDRPHHLAIAKDLIKVEIPEGGFSFECKKEFSHGFMSFAVDLVKKKKEGKTF